MAQLPDFTKWSPQELEKAEAAAIEFLTVNIDGIAATFDKRLALLRNAVLQLRANATGFEERMVYLSMIEELAHGLGDSARDFFDIGCQPSVANLIQRSV